MNQYDLRVNNLLVEDTMVKTFSQNVDGILDFTKEKRAEQTNCKSNFHHVARVPFALIQKLINEGRLNDDVFRDKEQMKKALQIVSTDYRAFMATDQKVVT